MSANYLKSLPYVDGDRMGVWGLSYGGFFTLIAVTDQPTLFRAGVDVAGVVDYAMYYEDPYHGGWTASRIGTPEQNPDVYKKASPLSNVGKLARPLLILTAAVAIFAFATIPVGERGERFLLLAPVVSINAVRSGVPR